MNNLVNSSFRLLKGYKGKHIGWDKSIFTVVHMKNNTITNNNT